MAHHLSKHETLCKDGWTWDCRLLEPLYPFPVSSPHSFRKHLKNAFSRATKSSKLSLAHMLQLQIILQTKYFICDSLYVYYLLYHQAPCYVFYIYSRYEYIYTTYYLLSNPKNNLSTSESMLLCRKDKMRAQRPNQLII